MLHEPVQQQLLSLGLKAAASAAARMQLSDEQIEALSALLESEVLERQSKAQNQRLKLAKLGQRAHPADVDLRSDTHRKTAQQGHVAAIDESQLAQTTSASAAHWPDRNRQKLSSLRIGEGRY